MKKSITFSFYPNSNEVEKIREKTSNFLKSHGLSDKIAQEQIMIVKELLKTCLRYSGVKSPQEKTVIQINISRDKISVEVSNPINGIQNKLLEELDKTIQFIHGHQAPFEAFLKLKAASGNRSRGLALARLAYEGRTDIDFFVNEDNIMKMSAIRTIN